MTMAAMVTNEVDMIAFQCGMDRDGVLRRWGFDTLCINGLTANGQAVDAYACLQCGALVVLDGIPTHMTTHPEWRG